MACYRFLRNIADIQKDVFFPPTSPDSDYLIADWDEIEQAGTAREIHVHRVKPRNLKGGAAKGW